MLILRRCIIFVILLITIYSCERVVDFNIPSDETKVVVEGSIETDGYPIVLLSNTVGFFDTIGIDTYADAFLHHAIITVSDGSSSVTLKEYNYEAEGLNFYVYTIDTADAHALNFKGEVGKTYFLEIIYKGNTYQSYTTIPEITFTIDSIWTKPPDDASIVEVNPNYRMLYTQFHDGPIKGEYVRLFNSINGHPFYAPYFSIADDDIINGTSVEVMVSKGRSKMNNEKDESEPYPYYYHVGDTVDVKFCAIDKATYEFYKTLEFSYSAIGNPFATPIVVTTNIQGGALGVWAGYNPLLIHHIIE